MFTGTLAMNFNAMLLDCANSELQPKFDGIRVQIVASRKAQNANDKRLGRYVETSTCTRSGGYLPNDYTRALLDVLPVGFDGELVIANDGATGEADFSQTMSGLTAKAGQPQFLYRVYDYVHESVAHMPYSDRIRIAADRLAEIGHPEYVRLVHGTKFCDGADLMQQVEGLVQLGYEGGIVRRTDLAHSGGRSGTKHPAVMRIKAWADCEARVLAVVPEVWHDCAANRKLRPELIGQPKDFAASFECEGLPGTLFAGQVFRAPLTVTDDVAREYLANADRIVGQLAKVRYLAAGVVNKPRLPNCIGIREDYDCEH